jgi:hypothetical protein
MRDVELALPQQLQRVDDVVLRCGGQKHVFEEKVKMMKLSWWRCNETKKLLLCNRKAFSMYDRCRAINRKGSMKSAQLQLCPS